MTAKTRKAFQVTWTLVTIMCGMMTGCVISTGIDVAKSHAHWTTR